MSESRKQTSWASAARCTTRTASSAAAAAASGPSSARSASVPPTRRNATDARRCSGCGRPRTCARTSVDSVRATRSEGGRGDAGRCDVGGQRRSPQQQAVPTGAAAEAVRREQRRGAAADHDLAVGGGGLGAHDAARPGAEHQVLEVGLPHQREVEGVAVQADGHPQHPPHAGDLDAAHLAQPLPHPDRRPAGPLDVQVAVEEQQQRVPAELHEAAAVVVRDAQQRREARVDRPDEELRALGPAARQPLREPGEPRAVGEEHRPRDRPDGAEDLGRQVLQNAARGERVADTIRTGLGPGAHHDPRH